MIFVFYVKNVNKTKTICLDKQNPTFVCRCAYTHSKYSSCYLISYVVYRHIFYVHFGAFSMVNLALKCTKKVIYTQC